MFISETISCIRLLNHLHTLAINYTQLHTLYMYCYLVKSPFVISNRSHSSFMLTQVWYIGNEVTQYVVRIWNGINEGLEYLHFYQVEIRYLRFRCPMCGHEYFIYFFLNFFCNTAEASDEFLILNEICWDSINKYNYVTCVCI